MLFDFLFGKKNTEEAPAPSAAPAAAKPKAGLASKGAAPGTQIHYSPELVAELKADHQLLLGIFGQIQASFDGQNLAGTVQALEEFRKALMGHLLKENVRFYIYLEHALAGDPPSQALVHDFRHEMDGIGRTVLAFLGKYQDLAKQPALRSTFAGELQAIGNVLVQRIRNEEDTLYPLYLPAY